MACSLYRQINVPDIGADILIICSTNLEGGVWSARGNKGADREGKGVGPALFSAG